MIHLEAKFPPAVNCKTRHVMYFQNTMVGRYRMDIPVPKGRDQKEGRDDRSQASPKPSKANTL